MTQNNSAVIFLFILFLKMQFLEILIAREHFSAILVECRPESEFLKPELSEAGKLICESLGLVDNYIKGLFI